jgi:hypothetical protein
MSYIIITSAAIKPEATTLRSTLDSRQWWREQAVIDGTSWEALHRQHVDAWRRLRSLADPFVSGLSSYASGTRP